jgi:hypothetical protein
MRSYTISERVDESLYQMTIKGGTISASRINDSYACR